MVGGIKILLRIGKISKYLSNKRKKHLHPPISMMEMNESKKEDEIKGKMETDDIREIFRLAENIPLC